MTLRFATALALAVLGAAGALRADEPAPPPGAVPSTGMPPFLPLPEVLADPDALRAWGERMAEAGRAAAAGSPAGVARRAAELLYSAASVLPATTRTEIAAARERFHEAQRASPPHDPLFPLAGLRVLRLLCALGHFEQARTDLLGLERWQQEHAPVDADAVTAARFALLRTEVATRLPVDAATLLEGLGDLPGAAARLERLAEESPPGLTVRRSSLWERAAVDRFRAGEPAAARADVDRALAAEPTPEQRARLTFWALHLRHGLLSEQGELRATGVWAGSAYLADLEETLRELSGNPHVGPYLLSAASSALVARADEDALALYLRALRDPALRERSWEDLDVVGGLLSSVPVAMRLGRFDEAEEILGDLERRTRQPVPELEALRVRLKVARAAAAEREAARDAPPPRAPEPTGPPPDPELLPPTPPEGEERAGPAERRAGDEDGPPAWPWAAAGAGLLLALWLAWRPRAAT